MTQVEPSTLRALARSTPVAALFLAALVGCGDAGSGDEPETAAPPRDDSTAVEPSGPPSESPEAGAPSAVPSSDDTSEPVLPVADAAAEEPPIPRCLPPEGVSGSPGTLVEVMDFINALPRPLTIPCVLEALDRPLKLTATNSFVSAQPAVGNANPRVFLRVGELYISVVSAGTGRELMEFGELTSNLRSYKAEIEFPLTGPLEPEMFYEAIMRTSNTVCAFCHSGETIEEHETLGYTFESDAYRPNPAYDVPIDDIRLEHELCDPELEPERCAMFSALFDHGPVEYHAFPEEMRIFF